MVGIDFDATTIDTRTYDDGGRMLTSAYNNGVSETRAYNNDNTLASINFTGAPIDNLSYNWDANKNKTSEGITGTMSGYGFDVGTSGYDDEDRLVAWNRDDNNLDQAWNLSLVGDWNSVTENASTQSRTHGPTHELLTAAGQTIAHDAKGNQTSIPAVLRVSPSPNLPLSLQWGFENKLISADTDNDAVADVTYQWDALGRRVGRDDGTTATVFVQSGQQTIADYTSGTAAASPTYTYVYANYIDEPVMRAGTGGLRYYHRNQQYSVIALTNGGGTIAERYAYSAYGTPTITDAAGTARTTSAENNRYTYTGREFDEALELYHYRARMYDSASGRFCSRDPIAYTNTSFNLYAAYFASKSALDPGGNDWVWPWEPNAEWWSPFTGLPSLINPGPLELPLEVRQAVWGGVCALSQSNGVKCACCNIELTDIQIGLVLGDIPPIDQAVNVLDCLCDSADIVAASCAILRGQGNAAAWRTTIPFSVVSCVLNAIDFGLSATGVGSIPNPFDVLAVSYEIADFATSQVMPCGTPCSMACKNPGGINVPQPPFPLPGDFSFFP